MNSFVVFLLLSSSPYVWCSRLPLVQNNMQAPIVVDIDLSNMNQELKKYIDEGIEKEVKEKCFEKIDNVVTHKHTELKSELTTESELRFKQLAQNLKRENEELKKQLQERNKVKTDKLVSKVTEMAFDSKKKYDNEISVLNQDIESKFEDLRQNSMKEREAFRKQVEKKYSDSTGSMKREIMELNKQVTSSQKRVALTACINYYAKRPSGYIWRFENVIIRTGVNNIDLFRKTGKFTCESAGLYLVSAWIMSNEDGSQFHIYKNGNQIVRVHITSKNRGEWNTGTGVVAVELAVNDTVWVSPDTSMYAHTSRDSCLTIVKIK